MSDEAPKLSIGLLVRNGENYLGETLDSLLGQTFSDFELIISDNASDDGTEQVCHAYASRDPRVRYVRNPRDLGVAKNFNQTVALSRGTYYKCCAHDDLYEAPFLDRCVDVLDREQGVVLSHCSARLIDGDGRPLPFDQRGGHYVDPLGHPYRPETPFLAQSEDPVDRFREVLLRLEHCFPIFGVIRTEVLRATVLHKDFYGGDRLILADLALRGRFRQIDEPLYVKRVHPAMSAYLSEDEKRKHIDPDRRTNRLQQTPAYLKAVFSAPLTPRQRLQCSAIYLAGKLRSATG